MATKKKAGKTGSCSDCGEPFGGGVSSSCAQHGGMRCDGCTRKHELSEHATTAPIQRFRDRIKELRRVRAGDLVADKRNWRRHGEGQARAIQEILGEVGFADALIARETPEGLVLIDGHLRAGLDPEQLVPVIVLDVDETEAGKILATLDPIAAMAENDAEALRNLLESIALESQSVVDIVTERRWGTGG